MARMLPPCAASGRIMGLLPNRAYEPGAMTRNRYRPFTFEDAAISAPRGRKVTSSTLPGCAGGWAAGRAVFRFARSRNSGPSHLDARRQVIGG